MAWIAKQSVFAGWAAGICFVLIAVSTTYLAMNQSPTLKFWTAVLYSVWTIGVPLWFFIEFVYESKQRPDEIADDWAKRAARLKLTQEAARPVWAACAAVVGTILYKLN